MHSPGQVPIEDRQCDQQHADREIGHHPSGIQRNPLRTTSFSPDHTSFLASGVPE